jgi:WD40 repeat protein
MCQQARQQLYVLCDNLISLIVRIMYWSLHDNNILCSFVGHTDSITHLDLNPLNSTFVSCSKDGSTRVWDYEKKQCLIRINKTKAACFDNTGNVLACVYLKDDKSNSSNDQGSA